MSRNALRSRFLFRGSSALTVVLLVTLFAISSCTFYPQTTTVKYIRYTVQRDDTIGELAGRFSVSTGEILQRNDIDDPRHLVPGTIIKIPYHGQLRGQRPEPPQEIKPPVPDKVSINTVNISAAKAYIGKLAWPVPGARLVSVFGRRWMTFHEGIDLAAPQGVPIFSAHDGVVAYSGDGLRGYGNLVVIKGDGILTVYGHNRRNKVEVGEKVRRGQEIAQVGMSGKATGPHSHFETRVRNKDNKFVAVDPYVFYRRR